jgi:hypothetical protein
VGGVYQIGSIVTAAVVSWLVRRRDPAFAWTLAATVCLTLAFLVWLTVVAPVNAQVADAMQAAPGSVPALWMELRPRWEYGHAAGFVLQLAGLCTLVASVVVETPAAPIRARRAPATSSAR